MRLHLHLNTRSQYTTLPYMCKVAHRAQSAAVHLSCSFDNHTKEPALSRHSITLNNKILKDHRTHDTRKFITVINFLLTFLVFSTKYFKEEVLEPSTAIKGIKILQVVISRENYSLSNSITGHLVLVQIYGKYMMVINTCITFLHTH